MRIRFIRHNGEERIVEGREGESLMQAGLNNGIGEILADCGGALSCATCHVHIAAEWMDRVGLPGAEEAAMLEMAVDPDERSRLSCQVQLDATLDGLVVDLPASQF